MKRKCEPLKRDGSHFRYALRNASYNFSNSSTMRLSISDLHISSLRGRGSSPEAIPNYEKIAYPSGTMSLRSQRRCLQKQVNKSFNLFTCQRANFPTCFLKASPTHPPFCSTHRNHPARILQSGCPRLLRQGSSRALRSRLPIIS